MNSRGITAAALVMTASCGRCHEPAPAAFPAATKVAAGESPAPAPARPAQLPEPQTTDAGSTSSATDRGIARGLAGSDGGSAPAALVPREEIDSDGELLAENAQSPVENDGPTPWLKGQLPESVRRTLSCEGLDGGSPPTTAEIIAAAKAPHTTLDPEKAALMRRWVCADPGATLEALWPVAEHRNDADGGAEAADAVFCRGLPWDAYTTRIWQAFWARFPACAACQTWLTSPIDCGQGCKQRPVRAGSGAAVEPKHDEAPVQMSRVAACRERIDQHNGKWEINTDQWHREQRAVRLQGVIARLRKEPLDRHRWQDLARAFVVAYYAAGDGNRQRGFQTFFGFKPPGSLLRDRQALPPEVKARHLRLSGWGEVPEKGWRFKLDGAEGWLVGDSYESNYSDAKEKPTGRGLAFLGEGRTLVIEAFAAGERVTLRDAVDIDGDGSPEFVFSESGAVETLRVVSLEKGAPVVRWSGGARPPAAEDSGD